MSGSVSSIISFLEATQFDRMMKSYKSYSKSYRITKFPTQKFPFLGLSLVVLDELLKKSNKKRAIFLAEVFCSFTKGL